MSELRPLVAISADLLNLGYAERYARQLTESGFATDWVIPPSDLERLREPYQVTNTLIKEGATFAPYGVTPFIEAYNDITQTEEAQQHRIHLLSEAECILGVNDIAVRNIKSNVSPALFVDLAMSMGGSAKGQRAMPILSTSYPFRASAPGETPIKTFMAVELGRLRVKVAHSSMATLKVKFNKFVELEKQS